jgi:hypothetical protein
MDGEARKNKSAPSTAIAQNLRLLLAERQVAELRILDASTKDYRNLHTVNGFFDSGHVDQFARAAAFYSGKAKGIYFTINPLKPDILNRRRNRIAKAEKGDCASDGNVLARRWLPIDADPVRDAKVSATDEEKAAALMTTHMIRDYLHAEFNWPDPVHIDSGNGYHLLYAIDLPPDDGGLVQRCLNALAQKFSTKEVKIDTSVFNPGRIWKIPGTLACKGDPSPDRPHRLAAILEPDPGTDPQLVPVTKEQLEALADTCEVPQPQTQPSYHNNGVNSNGQFNHRLKPDRWLQDCGIAFEILEDGNKPGRKIYLLHECPFDSSHAKGEAAIFQESNGKMGFHCFHNSCAGHRWQDVKEKIGKPKADHYDPPMIPKKKGMAAAKIDPQKINARPMIEITPEEHEVNDQAAAALARDLIIYQRAGVGLVHVVRDAEETLKRLIHRPANAPQIAPMPVPLVRERMTATAVFFTKAETKEGEIEVRKHPPEWCVNAVAARGYWKGIRPLVGVVDSPVLRADGTILDEPGYDPKSGLLYEPAGESIRVPSNPSFQEVEQARDLLIEVVIDFPFVDDAHKATWVAGLLTPLARHAFDGPTPLFLFDANCRGSGKGLLCDLIGIVTSGRPMPVMSNPHDDDECRKRITAAAISGDQLLLIDNIAGSLGCASLDAALTSTVWKDRILGRSEIAEMPLRATWYATGNNVVLLADTARRVAHIRLESPLEHPEEREGFKFPDLREYVRENRTALLAAALTILRGYCAAGRPAQNLKPWGSFEEWSKLVRSAVVWCGLKDPGESRKELRDRSDQEAGALQAILGGIEYLDSLKTGLTVSEIIKRLNPPRDKTEQAPADEHTALVAFREALLMTCPAKGGQNFPTARSIGMKFNHLKGRIAGGKYLHREESNHTGVWSVQGTTGNTGTIPATSRARESELDSGFHIELTGSGGG